MWRTVKENWPQLCFAMLLLGCLLAAAVTLRQSVPVMEADVTSEAVTLVLDPGHGGFDGGAISDDGTKESDLNLLIAQRSRLIAEFFGLRTVMTRKDDHSRTEYLAYSEHEDLVYRAGIVNNTPGALLVSIHQNDFPTGQPSGAQVLYAPTSGSEALGKLTHANLIRCLDPENRRVAEPAPKALYITANVKCPAILVECGFMSNNYEVEKLNTGAYQTSIAAVLVGSVLQYLENTDRM